MEKRARQRAWALFNRIQSTTLIDVVKLQRFILKSHNTVINMVARKIVKGVFSQHKPKDVLASLMIIGS